MDLRAIPMAAMALIVAAAAGCSAISEKPRTAADPMAAPAIPPVVGGSTSTAVPEQRTPEANGLPDGRSPVFIRSIDAERRTITFDLIQLLTGDAAAKRWEKADPGPIGGPQHHYLIINDNPRLRTLPVREKATIQMVGRSATIPQPTKKVLLSGAPGHFPGLPSYMREAAPFWLTVAGGEVTAIEQQYVPG